jgi:hypothetical protein
MPHAQQRRLVWSNLLQRLSLDPWNGSSDQPARLAEFDEGDKSSVGLEADEGSAS